MALDKLIAFLVVYSLSNTPLNGVQEIKKKPFPVAYSKVISSKASLGNTLEEQAEAYYAKEIVYSETKLVINPENALGKPDDKYAEIKPGGELTLKMEKPFSALKFGGIGGRVVTKDDCEYAVAVLVPTEERQGKIEYAWRWLLPSSIPGGIYNPTDGQVKVEEIKIMNNDTKDLHIDGIIGY